MSTKTELYDQDFYTWVLVQAALLKARQCDALDLDNLIEEVESIARQERHLLWHRFRTLLTHLVAWWGEVPARCLQWEGIITTQRSLSRCRSRVQSCLRLSRRRYGQPATNSCETA